MRKVLKRSILAAAIVLAAVIACIACGNRITTYTVNYSAGYGGSISGTASQTVTYGESAESVTAVPYTGYRFVKWSDNNTNPERTDTNVTSAINVTAEFTKITLTVTYGAGTGGSVSGTASQTVNYGESAETVTAVPSAGYRFVKWSDDKTTAERTDTNVIAAISVTAEFEKLTFTVTYGSGTGGSISGTTPQTVNYGESAESVTAVPNTGYRFVKWSDDKMTAERTDNNVTSAINVTAEFTKITLTVTYGAGTGGSVSGTTPQTVNYGENAMAVTAVPDTGYRFVKWSDNLTTAERTDNNVIAAISVTAEFEKLTFTVTYGSGTGGNISGKTSQTVTYGEDAETVTAIPDTGYRLLKWSDDAAAGVRRTDTNVKATIDVTALFIMITNMATYGAGEGGSISGTASQTVNYGESASTVTAVPSAGYRFVKWSDNVTTAERTDTNVTSAINVTAEFTKITLTVTYGAGDGGSISGKKSQTVTYGEDAEMVTAIPDTGYRLLKWSDDAATGVRRTDTNVKATIDVTALFIMITNMATYIAGDGGSISGEANQIITYGESASTVTAIPNTYCRFVKWSDNLATAERTDTNVITAINVTAEFELLAITFIYDYNNATGNNMAKSIAIPYEASLEQVTFAIPEKERFIFGGWYSDEGISSRVSDELGNLLIGDRIFDVKSAYLYAKWTPEDDVTYKILMVFVTEAHAVISGVSIDYTMSEIERQICELFTVQMSKYLNEWFDGLVKFEIDVYFTTVAIGRVCFRAANDNGRSSWFVFARDIPECSGMIENYRSVVTTSCMNDYDYLLHSVAGSAITKYASVHLEAMLRGLLINNIPLETLLDLTDIHWKTMMYVYLHEFTHTAEMALGFYYEFHAVIIYYGNTMSSLDIIKLYLLNQAILDGKRVGIPYSYWKGNAA
jgi:hypothetical protein